MNMMPSLDCCTLPDTQILPDQTGLENAAMLLKALAEPMRLQILATIASQGGEAVCACVFPDLLGIAQPTASHHLKRLTEAGLLTREQRGKWAWFSLVPEALGQVQTILGVLQDAHLGQ